MSVLPWYWLLPHIALALPLTAHMLLHKRDARAAALWLFLLWDLPYLGPLLYWMLGINRVARAARRRRTRPPQQPGRVPPPRVPAALAPLRRAGDSLARNPLCGANRIIPLENGDEAYPAMLTAIRQSRRTLALSSFIFDEDGIGAAFNDALCGASRRGVKVRVLVDGIGAFGPGLRLLRNVEASGGRVTSFWPRGRWLRHPGLNLRNHRKLLVADGSVGFTGGINISARHMSWAPAGARSRDLHFLVHGPVVRHLTATFIRDWKASCGEALDMGEWTGEPRLAGVDTARGMASGPDQDLEKLYELLLAAIRHARRRIWLMSPYFIPDRPILTALRAARRSGVEVRVVIPRRSDHPFMRWASRGYLWELVEAGVEVHEVLGSFIHSKVVVVDSSYGLVGSANLDPRSFRLNFEFNLEVYSRSFAHKLEGYIERQLAHSYSVTPADLRREPLWMRLRNQGVKLFSPYL